MECDEQPPLQGLLAGRTLPGTGSAQPEAPEGRQARQLGVQFNELNASARLLRAQLVPRARLLRALSARTPQTDRRAAKAKLTLAESDTASQLPWSMSRSSLSLRRMALGGSLGALANGACLQNTKGDKSEQRACSRPGSAPRCCPRRGSVPCAAPHEAQADAARARRPAGPGLRNGSRDLYRGVEFIVESAMIKRPRGP